MVVKVADEVWTDVRDLEMVDRVGKKVGLRRGWVGDRGKLWLVVEKGGGVSLEGVSGCPTHQQKSNFELF